MEPFFDWIHDFGATSWMVFWIPVLVWSAFAIIATILLKSVNIHPSRGYYLRFALLLALPVGLLFYNLMPTSALISSNTAIYVIIVNAYDLATVPVDPEFAGQSQFQAMHLLGLVSVLMGLLALIGLLRHSLQHTLLSHHIRKP